METVRRGSRGNAVRVLQSRLNIAEDGIFGPNTEEAVVAFQKAAGLNVDGIVGPKTWDALGVTANPRKIRKIIVHCSATPEGKDYTVQQIRDWHVKGNGWADIGYHWVVYRDGSVHAGRNEKTAGAHTTGHNYDSIGVCYIGGLSSDGKTAKDTRTPEQKEALLKLLRELKGRYPGAEIHGHREFAAKACPCFDAKKEYEGI